MVFCKAPIARIVSMAVIAAAFFVGVSFTFAETSPGVAADQSALRQEVNAAKKR